MTSLELAARIDAALESAVEREVVPGIAVAVTDRDGLIYEGARGRLGRDGAPATPATLFRLASMTKPLVSAAALALVEQGRLGLGQPVTEILPAFGELQVLAGFDGDRPLLRPQRTGAKIRDLLRHTSGHGYWWSNEPLARYREATGLADVLSSARSALQAPLVADPGERWVYGISTDWLGLAIEAVSGRDLGAVVADTVLAPLGMTDTSFAPSAEQRARLMPLVDRTTDGGFAPSAFAPPAQPEYLAGGHGAYGTVGDYARFMRALLRGGELDGVRVLDEATVALALSDQLEGRPLPEVVESQDLARLTTMPALPFRQGFGLGFSLMLEDVPEMRRAGTGAWAGVFNTYFWMDPASGVAAAVMTQLRPFFDGAVVATLADVERAVYA